MLCSLTRCARPIGFGGLVITGIAHVCYTVSDLDRAVAFYCDQLGLTPAFPFINDEGRRTGQYIHVGGRNFLELFEGDLADAAEGQAYRHLCLEVDDLQGTIDALRAADVEVTGIKIGKDRSHQAWIVDPDGNRIELHKYNADSKQTLWVEE